MYEVDREKLIEGVHELIKFRLNKLEQAVQENNPLIFKAARETAQVEISEGAYITTIIKGNAEDRRKIIEYGEKLNELLDEYSKKNGGLIA